MTFPALGVFGSGSSDVKEVSVQAFEGWLDRTVNYSLDFAAQDSFSSMESDGTWSIWAWNQSNPHRRLMLSIPLTMPGVPLSAVAAGQHDAEYQAIAQSMQWFQPKGWVRLGWEFNGNWYAWCPANPGNTAADYIAAYRHVAAIFRATAPGVRIIWNPNIGQQSVVPDTCYPGDDVVDYVGIDIYDNDYGDHDSASRWGSYLTQPFGLNWVIGFAAQHGKAVAVPEWGCGAAGDNPTFMKNMFSWMQEHNVALQTYWNDGPASGYNGRIDNGQYPLQAAAYKEAVQLTPPVPPQPVSVEASSYMTGGEGVGFHTGFADPGSAHPRPDSMGLYVDGGTPSGYGVGWLNPGQWYAYQVNLTADAECIFGIRVNQWGSGGSCHFEIDGVNVSGPITLDNNARGAPVALKVGSHVVRWLVDNNTGQNLLGFDITPAWQC